MISILKEQLDLANDANHLLNMRVDELVKLVESLQKSLKERDDKLDYYMALVSQMNATISSLEDALTKKDSALGKQERINRGLSKLMENKSEKQHVDDNTFFDSQEDAAKGCPAATRPKYNPKDRGNNGAKRNMHYEMETEEHDVYPDDPMFDEHLARFVGTRETIRYEFIPPRFVKHLWKLHVYSQNDTIMQGKLPLAPLQNSSYDGSFIAGLAELRFMQSLPVERIVGYFNGHGFDISKNTAHSLLNKTSNLFENLYKTLHEAVLSDDYVSCDETYAKVLVEEKNKDGKGIRKGYIWDIIANNLGLVYFFYENGSRSEKVILPVMDKFNGTMQSDAFAPYRKLGGKSYPNIIRLACLQHIKRKFLDLKGDPDADKMVILINKLYHKENHHPPKHGEWTVADNERWRRKYAPPILKEIKHELKRLAKELEKVPESDLAKAVLYMQNEMDDVENIFKEGNYNLDNNLIERYNRAISLYRRNSLFFGSHEGARRSAIFYSLACSCRMQGINFFEYISDILNRMPTIKPNAPFAELRQLLPDKWAKSYRVDN